MDAGLLLLRVVVGYLMFGHGMQKLAGWFGGAGITGTAVGFERLGFRPARPMAILAGATEAGSGLLLAFGLLTPLGSAAMLGTMVNAGSVQWKNGIWVTRGGYELPFLFGAVAVAIAFTGPGEWSIDHAVDLGWQGGGWGLAALGLGLATGAATLLRRQRRLHSQT